MPRAEAMELILETYGGPFQASEGPYFPFHGQQATRTEAPRQRPLRERHIEFTTPHRRPSDALFAMRAAQLREATRPGR